MTAYRLIANPRAGSVEREAVDAAAGRLGDVEVCWPEGEDDLDAALDTDRTVVVAGGDGSLHLVLGRAWRAGLGSRAIGVIPLGTGNDLARTLGVPLDPAAAAEAILGARTRPLDILEDHRGRIVVNAVHLGVGVPVAERATGWKERLGRIAYPAGALVAGLTAGPWTVTVTVDGSVVHDGRAVLVGIGIGRSIGGGQELFAGAEVDSGRAEVTAVAERWGPVGRLGFGLALGFGRSHALPWSATASSSTSVEIEGEAIGANADGELWDAEERWTFTVRPGALTLLCPGSA